MKMKKIVAGIVAAVLSMALCAPAFAATPGEEAQSLSTRIQQALENGNLQEAKAGMQEMTAMLQDNSVTVSDAMNNAALTYYDALEEAGGPSDTFSQARSSADENGVWHKVRYEVGKGFTSGPDFLSYNADASVITVQSGNYTDNPSSTGYAVTVVLPSTATASYYSVKMLGDNAQHNDTVAIVKYLWQEDGTSQKYVSFWVPHFSTYQLTAVTLSDFREDAAIEAANAVEDAIQSDWTENPEQKQVAESGMVRMTEQLLDTSITVTNNMSSAGVAYFDKLEESGVEYNWNRRTFDEEGSSSPDVEKYIVIRYESAAHPSLKPDTVTYSGETITLTIDTDEQTPTGYAITIGIPSNSTAEYYAVRMMGENAQENETIVSVQSNISETGKVLKYVSFWVPHFTTYQLTPTNAPEQDFPEQSQTEQNQSSQQPADEHPEIADAIANGTWGQSSATAAGSTAGSASTAENPIKKTGLSMDFGVFAVAALAVAAVCGLGYAATKSRKGE